MTKLDSTNPHAHDERPTDGVIDRDHAGCADRESLFLCTPRWSQVEAWQERRWRDVERFERDVLGRLADLPVHEEPVTFDDRAIERVGLTSYVTRDGVHRERLEAEDPAKPYILTPHAAESLKMRRVVRAACAELRDLLLANKHRLDPPRHVELGRASWPAGHLVISRVTSDHVSVSFNPNSWPLAPEPAEGADRPTGCEMMDRLYALQTTLKRQASELGMSVEDYAQVIKSPEEHEVAKRLVFRGARLSFWDIDARHQAVFNVRVLLDGEPVRHVSAVRIGPGGRALFFDRAMGTHRVIEGDVRVVPGKPYTLKEDARLLDGDGRQIAGRLYGPDGLVARTPIERAEAERVLGRLNRGELWVVF